MRDARGIRFTHAWWRSPANARVAWLIAGVLGVGIAWPLTLNLIVFGSLRRPREAGIDLSRVSTASADTPAADHADGMPQFDGAIDELLRPASPDAPARNVSADEPAVPTLSAGPLQAAAATPTPERKAFGAAEEDFYPTEIRAAKGKATTSPRR
jgi:hypothetical protein